MSSKKMDRIDYIELFDIPEAQEEIEDNTPSFDTTQQSLLSFAMPAIRWTDRQMQLMLEMSIAPLILALFLLGNRNVEKGYIHEYRIRELADRLGYDRQTIYRAIATLNALGFAKLRIRNKKLTGKVCDSPSKRAADEKAPELYPLKIATLHTDYLLPLLNAEPQAAVLKLYLEMAFYCDESTGEINTQKRPVEWAQDTGSTRVTVERGADWLIEKGFMHIKRDYVLLGRHPGVAMGFWQIRLTNLEKEKASIEKKRQRKKGIQPYEDILLLLRKMFGIDARNWAYGHIAEAQRILSNKMEVYGLADLKKLRERLQQKDDKKSTETPRHAEQDPLSRTVLEAYEQPSLSWKELKGDVPQGA